MIADVLRSLRNDDSVDFDGVVSAHPNLNPELADKLTTVRLIHEAADRQRLSESESDDRLAEPAEFLKTHLPAYEILGPIHYGGQGVVFRSIQRSTNRIVALKVLLDGPFANPRQKERFRREVELLSLLTHPNIVSVYDSGEVGGRQYLAMECVDGVQIDEYCDLHAPGLPEILRLFKTVCDAVSSAHQKGIIHRDLKPANILVDANAQPHVLDFGLAKVTGDAEIDLSSLSAPGQVVGTPPYLSPEQARGDVRQVDVRSDIYSLGVLLFQIITRAFPYPVHGDRQTILRNIAERTPLRLRSALGSEDSIAYVARHDIGDDLERIVSKALEKDPERRYQSAAEFADDIARYMRGDAVRAKSASAIYVIRKALRPYRWQIITVCGCVVLMVCAGLVWNARVQRKRLTDLQIGSFVRMGSVQRDQGRVELALALYEQAVKLAGDDPSKLDAETAGLFFSAAYQQAELCLQENRVEAARPIVEQVYATAKVFSSRYASDAGWLRDLAFAANLRGRLSSAENPETALADFAEADRILTGLLQENPDDRSTLLGDLAHVARLWGKCYYRMGLLDKAEEHYADALQRYEQLAEQGPLDAEQQINFARTELLLAQVHLRNNGGETHAALQRIDGAIERLETLGQTEAGRSLRWELDALMEAAVKMRRKADGLRQ